MTFAALGLAAYLVLDASAGAMQLETPKLGASQARPAGVDRPGQGDRVRPPPPPADTTPGQDRRSTRWLMILGGAAVIVALALTVGKRTPEAEPRKPPRDGDA